MALQPLTPSRFPARPITSIEMLAVVRSAFARWLADATADAERVEELEVVVSELGANAVRETPVAAEPAQFAAEIVDGDGARTVVIEVSNEVDAATVARLDADWDLDDPLRTGGRGLLLVSAFVDDVEVQLDGSRLVVRTVSRLTRQ